MNYLDFRTCECLEYVDYPQTKKSGGKFYSDNEKSSFELNTFDENGENPLYNEKDSYICPTYKEALDWMVNEQKLDIKINEMKLGDDMVGYTYTCNYLYIDTHQIYLTYDECLEDCIKFCAFRMTNRPEFIKKLKKK